MIYISCQDGLMSWSKDNVDFSKKLTYTCIYVSIYIFTYSANTQATFTA